MRNREEGHVQDFRRDPITLTCEAAKVGMELLAIAERRHSACDIQSNDRCSVRAGPEHGLLLRAKTNEVMAHGSHELYRPLEAADYIGISSATLAVWRREEWLSGYRVGATHLYTTAQLDKAARDKGLHQLWDSTVEVKYKNE
jgi:hypothetical protein